MVDAYNPGRASGDKRHRCPVYIVDLPEYQRPGGTLCSYSTRWHDPMVRGWTQRETRIRANRPHLQGVL